MPVMTGNHPIFMGVDGGGSRCRTRLRDAGGAILGSGHGGPANVHLDFDGAVATIRACMAETLRQAELADSTRTWLRVGLGLAGASSSAAARRVEGALDGFGVVRVVNDAVTACIGAHAGEDGGLIIAGTGSAGVARVAGRETIIGGRGFLLGDDGSGARIGLDAWRRALMAHDGLGPATAFTRELMVRFDNDPAAVIGWGQRARSSDYGAYAPAVFAAAATDDAVALDIVRQAAAALGEMAGALRRLGAERLVLVGGVADAIRPYLPPSMAATLSAPLLDALEGGILLVGGTVPLPGTSDLVGGQERR